ncbi:MAG: hypothetical protein LBU64_02255 [Planctomycetota bacterium]|nr:hypothetical protein [Planctomycetota bacterium]
MRGSLEAFIPIFHLANPIALALARVERARGFLEAATLSEDWIRSMSRRAPLLEAHHTTHIGGTRLTPDEAERLLAGEGVPEADIPLSTALVKAGLLGVEGATNRLAYRLSI